MILTSKLDTVSSINEAWLRESLEREARSINRLEVYNNRPNHFTVVADDMFEYMLDTTDYTAELIQHVPTFQDETLLVAVVDGSDNFEDKLAKEVINAVYQTL